MKPKEIKASLMIAEVSITAIAKKLGFTPTLVHMVIKGQRRNKVVRDELEKILARPQSVIWPE